MRRIVWSDHALGDLDDMVDSVGRENPDAADLSVDRIEQAVNLLAEMAVGRAGRIKGACDWHVKWTSCIFIHSLTDISLHIAHIIHTAREWPHDSWPADET